MLQKLSCNDEKNMADACFDYQKVTLTSWRSECVFGRNDYSLRYLHMFDILIINDIRAASCHYDGFIS